MLRWVQRGQVYELSPSSVELKAHMRGCYRGGLLLMLHKIMFFCFRSLFCQASTPKIPFSPLTMDYKGLIGAFKADVLCIHYTTVHYYKFLSAFHKAASQSAL